MLYIYHPSSYEIKSKRCVHQEREKKNTYTCNHVFLHICLNKIKQFFLFF